MVLLFGSTLATGINLAYNVAVAHFLGPKGFGNATALYTLLTLISAVTLSFQIITAKSIAQQGPADSIDAVYRRLHRAAWACGIFVAFLLIVLQRQITDYLHLPSPTLVMILAVGAAFYVPLGSRRGYIQGAFGFRRLATNLVLEGAVRLGGSLLMVTLGFGVTGVLAANAAAMAVAYFAIAPKLTGFGSTPFSFQGVFPEVSQAMVFFTGQVLINNCDIVLVKHFFAPGEAGLYAAIAMGGRVTFACSSAVVNGMFPVVAGSKDEERKNLSLIGTALLLVLGVGFLLALGLRMTPSWIWTMLFGAGFQIPGPHGFSYLLALYAVTTVVYCLSVVVMTYEMAYKIANTNWFQLVFSGILIAGICKYHASLQQVIMVQLVLLIVFLVMIAVPFLLNALRTTGLGYPNASRNFQLIRRIREDDVIAEFLKSDFEKAAYRKHHQTLRSLVFNPDLEDQAECAKRRALLALRNRALWQELPLDTQWYEAKIEAADLNRIRVFPRAQWIKLARGNFSINQVVDRIRSRERALEEKFAGKIAGVQRKLREDNLNAGSVLLIGLNESGPLTILDGNHRLVAGVLEGKVDQLKFICGLSTNMTQCCWYKTSLSNLIRYGSNHLRHRFTAPGTKLMSLFASFGYFPNDVSPSPGVVSTFADKSLLD